jgi:mannose-1-phosphate guanylyltransferase
MTRKLRHGEDIGAGRICAFVLCGGQGARLRSVVADRPKSMALISGMPFLQLLLDHLRSQGVDDVVLGTGYMAEQIESYFGSGNKLGLHIRYSREHEPLGTGGALKLAEPLVSDPLLVLNGDSHVEWRFGPMLGMLTEKQAEMVIALQAVADASRFGSVAIGQDGRITEFVEKGVAAGPGLINAGVYLVRKQIIRDLPADRVISLERDVFPRLLDRRVYGFVCTGLFIDIGIPEDLERAQTLYSGARAQL